MATQSISIRDDYDPAAVHKEAALFYGLFLRGHPAHKLRQDIEIPHTMVEKWQTHPGYDMAFRDNVKRAYEFRRQVLAVFDQLVDREKSRAHTM